jgi:NAD(P)-dependent dehydrogenase (short-subunit alcohol dehydrogenase family)
MSGRSSQVASLAHTYGRLDLDAVANPAERIGALPSYARSKLANVLHSLALARRLEGTTVRANCLHPGIVATNLLPRWVQWLQRLVRGQMLEAQRGAQTTLRLALAPEHADSHGLYFDENAHPKLPSARARDVALQEALWQRSLQWISPWLTKARAP